MPHYDLLPGVNYALTEEDEGKRVVGSEGELLGTIDKVDAGLAHVEPDAGDYEVVKRYLDWGSSDDEYTFQESAVEEATADEVVLQAKE